MNKNTKRLLLSLLLSLLGAFATQYWYTSYTGLSSDYGDKEPMAQIVEAINEVQRKPAKRLIWQSLVENESLFGGEYVRTTEASQARIEIIKTGTIIDLEPESLIALSESDGKVELEFLSGNLFLRGGSEAIILKTGASQINLANAELSLGRSKTGEVDMQVFKGNVDVSGGGVKKVQDDFKIIAPQPSSEVHILPDSKETVEFEWKELPKPANVLLELGKTRSSLRALSDQKRIGNKINARLEPGDYYWRLIGKSNDSNAAPMVSAVYRFKVLPKRPPVPLFPEKDGVIANSENKKNVVFKWANPGKLSDLVLEVAETPDLKKNPKVVRITQNDLYEFELDKNGTYYWRITGYIGQKREPVSSAIQKFNFRMGGDLTPPQLEFPVRGEKISFQTLKDKGVFLQWKNVTGAQNYKLLLKSKTESSPREELMPANQMRITDLKPGLYEWQVIAMDDKEKMSKPSETWTFSVDEMAIIQWRDQKEQSLYQYWTDKPELFVDWTSGPKETASYRVRWREEGEPSDALKLETVKKPEFKVQMAKDSRYIVSVEALNKDAQVLARTNDKTIEIKPMPLLSPPEYASDLPTPVKSTRSGIADVVWRPVSGAKQYVLQLKDSNGKTLKEVSVSSEKTSLTKLLPGDYQVQVLAIDQGGRRGIASESRPLLVPDLSDVRAPKVMKIKVE